MLPHLCHFVFHLCLFSSLFDIRVFLLILYFYCIFWLLSVVIHLSSFTIDLSVHQIKWPWFVYRVPSLTCIVLTWNCLKFVDVRYTALCYNYRKLLLTCLHLSIHDVLIDIRVQLVQLRQTVGRMLGLNVGPDSSVNFEIVSRLEKLILANRNNMASTIPVDASFEQLAQAFRQAQAPCVSFDLDKSRSKPRSVSPTRKRDTKVY